ncbi:hypothetical protein SIN01_26720 [Sporolactobacillus inulinus]|nr:hypothetical protein SIN01_26720 [Sporolactobacillus inulinus]
MTANVTVTQKSFGFVCIHEIIPLINYDMINENRKKVDGKRGSDGNEWINGTRLAFKRRL